MQHEITQSHPLLNEDGDLTEAGYATRLLPVYNKPDTRWHRFHTKEWDYYYIGDQHHGLALTIADNGYMGLDSISMLDFDRRWEITKSAMQLMTMGRKGLPATSVSGDVASDSRHCRMRFANDGRTRVLDAVMDGFRGADTVVAHVELTDVPDDSMVICTPFDKPRHFYFNQKINGLRARGTVQLGGETWTFEPDSALATLDWGRGVWTYSNTWYWSSLNAPIDGHRFGFNLGYGFGNTTAASENMLFYDGKAVKVDQVSFAIPAHDGKDDFMAPWKISSNDGLVNLDFIPVLDRHADTDMGIIASYQHQVFGRFSGYCRIGRRKVVLDGLMGFAEKVRNRW